MNAAKEFIVENLYWIVPVVVFAVIFFIVLWLVFTWLSSRGRFMFLHCVAGNKAEVKIPWAKFREHANSLFVFRIVLGLVGFVVIMLPLIVTIILVVMMVSSCVLLLSQYALASSMNSRWILLCRLCFCEQRASGRPGGNL